MINRSKLSNRTVRTAASFLCAVASIGLSIAAYADGRWVHNVTGGGQDSYPADNYEPTFRITFNARVDAQDVAEGMVRWWFLDGRPASYGEVSCLEVRGNRAYIAYQAEGGEFGDYGLPGNTVLFAVQDNGEGYPNDSDRQSFISFANFPVTCGVFADFIDSGIPGSGFPVIWLDGNVQVR